MTFLQNTGSADTTDKIKAKALARGGGRRSGSDSLGEMMEDRLMRHDATLAAHDRAGGSVRERIRQRFFGNRG